MHLAERNLVGCQWPALVCWLQLSLSEHLIGQWMHLEVQSFHHYLTSLPPTCKRTELRTDLQKHKLLPLLLFSPFNPFNTFQKLEAFTPLMDALIATAISDKLGWSTRLPKFNLSARHRIDRFLCTFKNSAKIVIDYPHAEPRLPIFWPE